MLAVAFFCVLERIHSRLKSLLHIHEYMTLIRVFGVFLFDNGYAKKEQLERCR
jgi:hypothetical protein